MVFFREELFKCKWALPRFWGGQSGCQDIVEIDDLDCLVDLDDLDGLDDLDDLDCPVDLDDLDCLVDLDIRSGCTRVLF